MNIVLALLTLLLTLPVVAQDEKPLEITPIADGVFIHTSFKYIQGYGVVDSNGLIAIDKKQAYIIDTPWSEPDTKLLLSWLSDRGYKAVASISTHFHEDRTAGIEFLNSKSIPTYTSELTHRFLVREGKPVPTHYFSGDGFTLGNGLIELYYPGAGHSEDNIVAWLPKSRMLFGGCLVRSHEWEGLGNITHASVSAWADSIENIKSKNYPIQMVIPGHGKVGGPDILDHTIKLAKSASDK
jgi:metallo-beta-lactamase class B/metallo-beta-lactamase class B GIM